MLFKRRALGKGRKVYVCGKHMRFAKRRHSAPKRTSGCRASGRRKSIPIHRISFCRHLRARSDTPLYSYNVCAEKFQDKRRRNIPSQNELFGKQEPDSNARVSLRAFRAAISTRTGQGFKQICRFFEKYGDASEKRKTISFRNAFTLAPPAMGKTDLFHPFCRRLGISEAKFGENSAKNKKKSRVEAVKRAELRFSRNPTVHSGGTPFRKQKKCRQNAAASENRVCASFVRPFAPLSASRPRNPMRIDLCLLRHRMSSDTVSADELLINP